MGWEGRWLNKRKIGEGGSEIASVKEEGDESLSEEWEEGMRPLRLWIDRQRETWFSRFLFLFMIDRRQVDRSVIYCLVPTVGDTRVICVPIWIWTLSPV